jgi:beta-glucanase (GH16 family)
VTQEFIGGENYRVQSNYFGKGDTSTYDRMNYIPVSDPQNDEHTYSVNWTSSAITWLVDGAAVRTLTYEDAQGGSRFPQTPMKLKVGIWAGGDPAGNAKGTVTWAMGGQPGSTDYSKGPFSMFVESINIVNYSPADTYKYKDNTGSWESIDVIGGTAGGIVSPGQIAAEQSTISSSAFTVTTGSAAPIQPLATATANGTASASLVTSVKGGTTVVAAAATGSAASGASASQSSGAAQATGNAGASVGIAGGLMASALLAMLMVVSV